MGDGLLIGLGKFFEFLGVLVEVSKVLHLLPGWSNYAYIGS